MISGPGLFSDIGKRAKDLLNNDYIPHQKFSISSCSDSGVAFTSTALKTGGMSTGDVAALYTYNNTVVNVKVDTESNITTTFIINDIIPSTKTIASLKVPDYSSGMLQVQYFHNHATLTTALALNKSPLIDFTATLGTPTISFGVEAGYDTTSSAFTKYTAGLAVSKPESSASIVLGDKGDTIKASYLHHLDQQKKSAAVAEISRRFSTNDNTFTVGGSYAVDHLTLVKAKLNNHGKLGAVVQHEIMPKSMLTIASEFDTMNLERTPKFGLALTLKP